MVNFKKGCTTGFHKHTSDQILVITLGSGMVATETEQFEVNVGDVVHIKKGENHWHGAKADSLYVPHNHHLPFLDAKSVAWVAASGRVNPPKFPL